jgi:hypothetical protein
MAGTTQVPTGDLPALGGSGTKPSIFISHRHVDSAIANALRMWLDDATDNGVTVYQSSSAPNAPLTGDPLNKALGQQLHDSSLILCPYTRASADWSWCMWECGLATHPLKADTRVVVLRFSDHVPSPLSHLLDVDARDAGDVTKFVTDLLTAKGYIPNHPGALTGLPADSPKVERRAADLFKALRKAGPPEPRQIWESWSVLALEFELDEVERAVNSGTQSDRESEICKLLEERKACTIVEGYRLANKMFGIDPFPETKPFADLYAEWEQDNPGATPWRDSVAKQIALRARRHAPATDWVVVPGAIDQLSIPVLCWTVRDPAQGTIQFHLYFIPVKRVDPSTGGVELGFAERPPEPLA